MRGPVNDTMVQPALFFIVLLQDNNDSPGLIDQEKDIYALPSKNNREIYFLALVDILTTFGVKKQAAKYAKTVKYGARY